MADLSQLSVIFDLDGTLIDSAPDIHATANRVLGEMGFAPLSAAVVQGFVGKGLPNLVTQLLRHVGEIPDGPRLALTIARFEREYLTAHSLTTVYPGVMDALGVLRHQGATLGLCTNKPLGPTQAVLNHLNLTPFFAAVLGGDSLAVRKPDPAHLQATARLLDRPQVVFVGDSEVDAETATAARLPFLLFTEGYRKTPVDQIAHTSAFDTYASLPALIAGMV